jgi:lipopolysaccharide export system permease protein
MLSVIDRYILRSLVVNYAIALAIMVSLYIALDLFVNMDEFTESGHPTLTVAKHIVGYYWPNVFLYFAQLSGAITLFSCLATLARMRRQNELTAMLASGVSLYRAARPILAFGIITSGLMVVDTEWVIPSMAHLLARDHDDADGSRAYEVLFLRDRDDALLSARRFHPGTQDLNRLLVLKRDVNGALVQTLEADRATWNPLGFWSLDRARKVTRVRRDDTGLGPRGATEVAYPTVYESDLSPQTIQLRQSEGWIGYLGLAELTRLAERSGPHASIVAQTIHARRTAPIVSIILLLLGLPFFLDRSPANVLSDAGKCIVLCGLCYVSTFVVQSLRSDTSSALPAWLPIFVFGTLAVVLVDRIRT